MGWEKDGGMRVYGGFKRKREGSGEEDIEGEEEWAQKRSKKTERVQDDVREGKKS